MAASIKNSFVVPLHKMNDVSNKNKIDEPNGKFQFNFIGPIDETVSRCYGEERVTGERQIGHEIPENVHNPG